MKMSANEFNEINSMFIKAHNTTLHEAKSKKVTEKVKLCKKKISLTADRHKKLSILYKTVNEIRVLNDFEFDADIIDSETFLTESNDLTEWEVKMINLIHEGIL